MFYNGKAQVANSDTAETVITKESKTIRIPLTRGFFATIDAEDAAKVFAVGSWYATVNPKTSLVYAVNRTGRPGWRRPLVQMHRLIASATAGQMVDHINHNGLDNRKCNLRLCSHSQNMGNARKRACASSQYKGVCRIWYNTHYVFRAKCRTEILGRFDNETAAARAYDRRAIEVFGEFALTNFPREDYA